ncbi:glycosyltransferase family 2 protein [Patescibacteria group bacterium AH-259-L07]|nr:glycosyltransferase family 2 protein [Patescibacteria group bacterium AH-259-L07]
MIPKVYIQIVTFNSQRFIKSCLDSVFLQTFQDFSVLVIDNASRDDTVSFVKERYTKQFIGEKFNSSVPLFVVRNPRNTGFSYAHNQGIVMSKSEFILVMNPDMILKPDFLLALVKTIEKDTAIASVGGKLLRLKLGDPELDEKIKTTIIDTTGIHVMRSRRVIDRGEGEQDKGQYDKKVDVFGISGACSLYRRLALEDVSVPIGSLTQQNWVRDEYFDQDFFAYKEDADISWRLQLRGWKAQYVSQAVAYHFRAGAPLKKRFSQSTLVNYLSYRNHLWTVLKNTYWSNFFTHLIYIFFYQLVKELYLFFTQPFVLLKASFSFWMGFKKMLRKRKYIMKNAKVDSKEMRKWFK